MPIPIVSDNERLILDVIRRQEPIVRFTYPFATTIHPTICPSYFGQSHRHFYSL